MPPELLYRFMTFVFQALHLTRVPRSGPGGHPGGEALDSDQSLDQADQDGWATGTPCPCRGVGDQGNADRDPGTDQPASAGTG